jgi:NADH:ubiquinone oxidoreductase subunit K
MTSFYIDVIFAVLLFGVGLFGVTNKSDFLKVFFALEMLLNAVILMLASAAVHLGLTQGLAVAYVIIVLATLEAAAGVLIFLLAYRMTGTFIPDDMDEASSYVNLKGFGNEKNPKISSDNKNLFLKKPG